MPRGAEELYRSGPFAPYNQQVLQQMQGQTGMMRGDMSRAGDIQAAGMRERSKALADLPMQAYGGYRRGKEDKQKDIAFEEDLGTARKSEARAEEAHSGNVAAQKMQMEQSRAQMGRAQAEEARRAQEHEFMHGPREGKKTRAAEKYERGLSSEELSRTLMKQQLMASKAQQKALERDYNLQQENRALEKATMMYEQAIDKGPDAVKRLEANLRGQGMTNENMQLASFSANRNISQGRRTEDLLYSRTPEGAKAEAELDSIFAGTLAAEDMLASGADFEAGGSTWTDRQASQALNNYVDTLRSIGRNEEADSLEDTIWNPMAGTRAGRIQEANQAVIADLQRRILRSEQAYAQAPSKRLQDSIRRAKERIQRLTQSVNTGGNRNQIQLIQGQAQMGPGSQNRQFITGGQRQPQPVGGFQPAPEGAGQFIQAGGMQQPPPQAPAAPPPQQPFYQGKVNPRGGQHQGRGPIQDQWRSMHGR